MRTSTDEIRQERADAEKARTERIVETARFMLAHGQGENPAYIYSEVRNAFARAVAFEGVANKLRRGEDV